MTTYHSLLATAPQSARTGWMADAAAATAAPSLPRRPRAGATIASVVMSGALFASVALGMTSMAKDREQLVAPASATSRA